MIEKLLKYTMDLASFTANQEIITNALISTRRLCVLGKNFLGMGMSA